MVKDQIRSPVTEPTDWVQPIVVVEKPNGKLWICLDPKPLNDAICQPHYAMSTLDDVTVKLAGPTHFSRLDLTHVYTCSLQLDKESSYLTTFATPFQRYRFLHLPYGCKALSDIIHTCLYCRSTADLEGFHQHILMYCSKRFSYSPPVYRCQNLLAALDNNMNLGRDVIVNKHGTQRYNLSNY